VPHKDPILYKVSEHIDRRMQTEKKKFTNLDFYAASAYYQVLG